MSVFIPLIDPCLILLHHTGKPCDENGQYLPTGSPPPPCPAQAVDDWMPFADGIQFKLADFLYHQEEMSQGNINRLLELWALSLMQHGSLGPFDSYKHIYDTIDAIEEGKFIFLSCLTSLMWNRMQVMRYGSASRPQLTKRMHLIGRSKSTTSGTMTPKLSLAICLQILTLRRSLTQHHMLNLTLKVGKSGVILCLGTFLGINLYVKRPRRLP